MALSRRAKGLDAWLLAIPICSVVRAQRYEEMLFDLRQKDVKTKSEQVKAEGEYSRSDLGGFQIRSMLSNN